MRTFKRKGFKTYTDVLSSPNQLSKEKVSTKFIYYSKEEVRSRFLRAYVGKVIVSGPTFNIQTTMEMKDYYATKFTPKGDNWCLIEELEEGFLADTFGERKYGGISCLWR